MVSIKRSHSYYNNDASNNIKYGKLYNWFAVSGTKNVCPTGWHVPTDAEWTVLKDYLGGASWNSPNTDATNMSLFSALPGGFRNDGGDCNGIDYYGYWWSSTESNTGSAWSRYLYDYDGNANRDFNDKRHGLSVRCVGD